MKNTPKHLPAALLVAALATACGPDQPEPARDPLPATQPAWFEAFDGADRQFLFVNELRRYFVDRGERAEIDAEGRLLVTGKAGTQHFVVARLAEVAAGRPTAEWEELIANHFEAMAALRDAVGDVAVPPWEEARSRLRIRIYPGTFLQGAGLTPDEVVTRVDLPGTFTVLVVDSAKTALVVPAAELRRWGQRAEDAMALAYANTRRALADELEVMSRDFPNIGALRVLTGESFYSASAALWLDEYEGLLGEHGAIVAIPWRHGVFVYPFEDARVQTVVPALYRYAQRIVEDSAGPIGARIWWRRADGDFEEISIDEVDGKLEILPPRDLAELLSTMK